MLATLLFTFKIYFKKKKSLRLFRFVVIFLSSYQPRTLVSEYFSCIVDNDIDMVRELLDGCDGENAVDINSVASDGSTALQVALEHKHYGEKSGILL